MSSYVRGAGLLTAEFSVTGGTNIITATQAASSKTFQVQTQTAADVDIRRVQSGGLYGTDPIVEGDAMSIGRGTWEVTMRRFEDTFAYPSGGNAYYFEIRAPFETIDMGDPDEDELEPIVTTWNSTAWRDLLGFSGSEEWVYDVNEDIAILSATRRPQGIWYPGCPMVTPYGNGIDGHLVTDMRKSVSPLGHVRTLIGNRMRLLEGVYWSHVAKDLAITDELDLTGGIPTSWTVSGSETRPFQEFIKATQWGDNSFFEPGSAVRLYWDFRTNQNAPSATDYFRGRFVGLESTKLDLAIQGWDKYYTVRLPTLIEVPT